MPGRHAELHAGARSFVAPVVSASGLDAKLADAVEATRFDDGIPFEADEALGRTGRDGGTPIPHFDPPAGTTRFGPVISRLPVAHKP